MSVSPPRSTRWLTLWALSFTACAGGSYGVRARYEAPEPAPEAAQGGQLVSAQLTRYGVEPPPLRGEAGGERMVEGGELSQDALLLVFTEELDPLTLTPLAFGILRADGRRVRPTRAFLGPSDEGDENRSVTLLGNFGSSIADTPTPPIAVHVIRPLYAESGAVLEGLDANVSPPTEPDRPVIVERLAPNESRCPGSAQMIRSYWTDTLTHVGADDLAGVDLRLGDGRVLHPTDFDDQARREDDPPCPEPFAACLGPADDNVLDLCIDVSEPIVHLHFAAGLFSDPAGLPSAAADVALPPPG